MPTNTEAQSKTTSGAMAIIADAMGRANPSDAILDMEARGQRELVGEGGARLPANGSDAPWVAAAGIVVVGPVDGDPLFVEAQLPAGWRVEPTNHSMYSDLCDDRGRVRAGIFYKAAFYDRCAWIAGRCRFGASYDYDEAPAEGAVHYVYDTSLAKDRGDPRARIFYGGRSNSYADRDRRDAKCREWLDAHHPNWRDPCAYWD